MRLILDNKDAVRLEQMLEEDEQPGLTIDHDGKKCTLWVEAEAGNVSFRGRARRTPGSAGSIVIEDLDGRVVVEVGTE